MKIRQGDVFIMKELLNLVIFILGVALFIYLLPTLLWLAFVVLIVVTCYVIYQRYKYRHYQKEMEQMSDAFEQTNYTSSNFTNQNIDSDVIDVEYSESEEDAA